MNDLASPKMQQMYHEQLKEFSLRHMYSRAGKNTRNNHFEFMQAHAREKQENLDECDRTKPKVVTHMGDKKTRNAGGQSQTMKEKIQKLLAWVDVLPIRISFSRNAPMLCILK